jgi:hypothetical protein
MIAAEAISDCQKNPSPRTRLVGTPTLVVMDQQGELGETGAARE